LTASNGDGYLQRVRLLRGTESGSISFGAEVGGGRPGVGEVLGEDRVQSAAEEKLGTAKLRKSEPHHKGELEEIVEGEPVGEVHSTLEDSKECEADPVSKPLGVISLADGEQGLQGVVGWDDETRKVGEELTSEVQEDQEEIKEANTADDVNLGDIGLLLEVNEHRVF